MALTVTIDAVDRISFLIHESLSITQSNDGLNSTCEFDLIDQAVIKDDVWTVGVTAVEDGDYITDYVTFYPDTKVEVSVTDGATTYFAGVLSSMAVEHRGQIDVGGVSEPTDRVLHCSCHDFNSMLEESVVDELEEYGASTVEEIIDDIFTKYVTGIDFATHVTAPFAIAEISFESVTVRQVMDTLCAQSGYIWYVDYSKKLHCALVEVNSPAWHLSDNPDGVNSFAYLEDIAKEVDAVNLVNRVFVVGGITALWFEDDDSIAEYGIHQAIVRDTSLVDIEDIEDKGEAALAQFKDPTVTYKVRTYKDGLRAGMHVRIVCAFLDVDETYLVNNLAISFPVDGDPIYEVTMGGLESSISVSAHRLTLDQIHDAQSIIMSSQMPIASQGWGHDLVFTATDFETVAWTAGTLTTAGGYSLSISAGNTDDPGAMVAKTIVYFDAAISATELQMTTDETVAMGSNRIMVAVCWPGIEAAGDQPEVLAGFQVFGASSGGVQTFLNADNVAADCITANEIYVNQLSAINANMGTITAGTIQTGVAGNDRVVINMADGIRGIDAANVVQFQLDPATGKAYAGAGVVWLDESGLNLSAVDLDPSKVKWIRTADSEILAEIGAYETAGTQWLQLKTLEPTSASVRAAVKLLAEAPAGAYSDTSIILYSQDDTARGDILMYVGGTTKFGVYYNKVAVINEVPFQIYGGNADPTVGIQDGMLYYRRDTDKLRLRANGAWVDLN